MEHSPERGGSTFAKPTRPHRPATSAASPMTKKTYSAIGLIAVATVATAVWRAEVLAHPQGGWDFVAYTHLAVPLGIGLFIAWLAVVAPVPTLARRMGLVAVTVMGAAIWYPLLRFAMLAPYSWLMFDSSVTLRIKLYSVYVLMPLTPVLFAWLLWCFGAKPKASQLVVSVLIYVAAVPTSAGLLRLFHYEIERYLVDAVKTGLIIPFLIVGLGVLALPFVGGRAP